MGIEWVGLDYGVVVKYIWGSCMSGYWDQDQTHEELLLHGLHAAKQALNEKGSKGKGKGKTASSSTASSSTATSSTAGYVEYQPMRCCFFCCWWGVGGPWRRQPLFLAPLSISQPCTAQGERGRNARKDFVALRMIWK